MENWWFDGYFLLKNDKRKLVLPRVFHDCRPDYVDKNKGSNWNYTGKLDSHAIPLILIPEKKN